MCVGHRGTGKSMADSDWQVAVRAGVARDVLVVAAALGIWGTLDGNAVERVLLGVLSFATGFALGAAARPPEKRE